MKRSLASGATRQVGSAAGRSEGKPLVSRVLWSALSQGLSSITNFGLLAALTIVAEPDRLGRLVSLLSIYLLALTLSRSLVTESLVASAGDRSAGSLPWRWARGRLLALGVCSAALCAVLGLYLQIEAAVLWSLVAAVPVLLLQDGQRYLAWAGDRPGLATSLDGLWFGVSSMAIVSMAFVGSGSVSGDVGFIDRLSPTVVIGAWIVGGVLSWLFGWLVVERRLVGDRTTALNPALGRYRGLALSQALYACAFNLMPVAMAVVVSPVLAAALKSLLVPFLPILSLFAGLRVVTLPLIRGSVDERRRSQPGADPVHGPASATRLIGGRILGAYLLVSIGAGLIVVRILWWLPQDRLGPSLAQVRPYLLWGVALTAMFVVSQLLADGRGLSEDSADVVRRRVSAIGTEWTFIFLGAALGDLRGLVGGWAAGLALATLIWMAPTAGRPGRLLDKPSEAAR